MRLEREQLLDLEAQLQRTWIATDGAGAYAAGSPLGCGSSRTHGLLVAPTPGGGALHVFLARLEEWLHVDGRSLPLSCTRYPGGFFPGGHTYLSSFDSSPLPLWRWQVGDVTLTRQVRLLASPGKGHCALVRYTLAGPPAPTRRLSLRPLLACRAVGELTFENVYAERRVEAFEGGFVARPYPSLPALSVTVAGAPARFAPGHDWYRRIEYVQDLRAGLAGHEDHLTPGLFEIDLPGRDGEVVLAATTGPAVADPLAAWLLPVAGAPRARGLRATGRRGGGREPLPETLNRAADDHLVVRGEGVEVLDRLPGGGAVAHVRWQALPGLLLARERFAQAQATLLAHADVVVRGAASADGLESAALGLEREAALAWAGCVEALLDGPGGTTAGRRALAAAAFALGARLREAARGDAEAGGSGLLSGAAQPGPRRLDVALNARWAGFSAWLATRARGGRGADRRGWPRTAQALAQVFRERFWLSEAATLASAWLDGNADASFTPAAVAAASEPRGPLSAAQRLRVLERAKAELLTPRGLRTLSPRDEAYAPAAPARVLGPRAAWRGAVEARWVEPYVRLALLAAPRERTRAAAALRPLVEPSSAVLAEHGLGHIAEAYDGDPPHAAGGAASDARAVAALIRARSWLAPGDA